MTMNTSIMLLVAALLTIAIAAAWACWRLTKGPGGRVVTGLIWLGARIYGRLMHRTQYEGLDLVPQSNAPGGLIVVSNHTSAIDPVLIQAACRFQIRWMMAGEMMVEKLDWLWNHLGTIPVGRAGRDMSATRTAIRHVQNGGILGIFPEGGLVRPRCELRPFAEGAGFIIAKTKAPVLLVWIRDTPEPAAMMPALRCPSHSKVTFVEMMTFDERRPKPAEVTRKLRERLAQISGWPINDDPREPHEEATERRSDEATKGAAASVEG